MSEKQTKEKLKDEMVSLFDQLIANSSDQPIENEAGQDLNESQAQNLVLKGRSEIENKKFASALKLFNQALELDPQCEDAWSAMGDALMEMGKIDQASICYKKAMASTFGLDEGPVNDHGPEPETNEADWQDYLMSFLDNKKESPENKTPEGEKRAPIPKQSQPGSEGLDTDLENLNKIKEEKKDQPRKEALHFPCPSCGSDVELDSGVCSQCQATFNEEKFDNYEPMDDDLVFFGRIKALLGKEERFFIHFNGEDGSIRFLDKRETSKTKKPSYIFVSANVEQLGFDYSTGSSKTAESKDKEAQSEE